MPHTQSAPAGRAASNSNDVEITCADSTRRARPRFEFRLRIALVINGCKDGVSFTAACKPVVKLTPSLQPLCSPPRSDCLALSYTRFFLPLFVRSRAWERARRTLLLLLLSRPTFPSIPFFLAQVSRGSKANACRLSLSLSAGLQIHALCSLLSNHLWVDCAVLWLVGLPLCTSRTQHPRSLPSLRLQWALLGLFGLHVSLHTYRTGGARSIKIDVLALSCLKYTPNVDRLPPPPSPAGVCTKTRKNDKTANNRRTQAAPRLSHVCQITAPSRWSRRGRRRRARARPRGGTRAPVVSIGFV